MKRYAINEVFYSLQGEGMRAGTANVFVRFSGCNLACNVAEHGFDCDTEFVSNTKHDADGVLELAREAAGESGCRNVIFTGGEPLLQLDEELLVKFKGDGWFLAVETNGTLPAPTLEYDKGHFADLFDWVCVSPKTAEHTIRVGNGRVDEVKYVRRKGQGIPKPSVRATHLLISPAFENDMTMDRETLAWCVGLCKDNPEWRLSTQQHKAWRVR